jgi:hypothetical protein
VETACCSNESTDAGSPSQLRLGRVNIPLRAGNVELLLQHHLAREERVGDRGKTAVAADTGCLFHCGCGFQRGLPCLDTRAARIKGEIRFLHCEYHALLLTVELQVGGEQGLCRAGEIRGAPTEIQQQPIQPHQRLEHAGANQEWPHLVVVREMGIAGHAYGAERRQIGAFGNPEPGSGGARCFPRRTRLGVCLLGKIDQIRQVVDPPMLNCRGRRSRPRGKRIQRGFPAGNARRLFRRP